MGALTLEKLILATTALKERLGKLMYVQKVVATIRTFLPHPPDATISTTFHLMAALQHATLRMATSAQMLELSQFALSIAEVDTTFILSNAMMEIFSDMTGATLNAR